MTDYGLALLIRKGYTKGSSSVVEISTNSTSAVNPVRWMALESLQRRQYSKKSDVWSYGVLKYEIWSLGFMPYHNIYDDNEVSRAVIGGERLPRPDKCPEQMYAIMESCWRSAPKDRPSMSDVQTRLQESFAEAMLEASQAECVVCLNAGDDCVCVCSCVRVCMHACCMCPCVDRVHTFHACTHLVFFLTILV